MHVTAFESQVGLDALVVAQVVIVEEEGHGGVGGRSWALEVLEWHIVHDLGFGC